MSPAIRHVLVLCEGNHCRSPLAEALLLRDLAPDITVSSAGLGALVGQPVHEEVARVASELGLDLSGHRGRQFSPELALNADLILVMDQAQKAACEFMVPSARGRVFLLGHWLPEARREIADPYQQSEMAFRRTQDHILQALGFWMTRLARKAQRTT